MSQTGLIRQATMRGSFSCDGRVLNHPTKADQPRTRVLSPEELATYIEDLPKVSPEERRKAIEVRRRAVHERFGG